MRLLDPRSRTLAGALFVLLDSPLGRRILIPTMEPASHNEIASTVLGASAALAGILLVFVGLLFARADSIPTQFSDAVAKKYRRAAAVGLIPVIVGAAVMMASYEWLLSPSNALYLTWRWGFWVEAVSFVAYGCVAVWMLGGP